MKRRSLMALLALSFTLVILVAGCAASDTTAMASDVGSSEAAASEPGHSQPEAALPTMMNDEGRVEIRVTPVRVDQTGQDLAFAVEMDTHSVDLGFDLSELAWLRSDQRGEVGALSWTGGRGGHHVSGVLQFPAMEIARAEWIELSIRSVADVPERVFHWDLAG